MLNNKSFEELREGSYWEVRWGLGGKSMGGGSLGAKLFVNWCLGVGGERSGGKVKVGSLNNLKKGPGGKVVVFII